MNAEISLIKKAIGVVTAHYHQGTTAEYILSACERLGIKAQLLSPEEFLYYHKETVTLPKTAVFSLFLCIDSQDPVYTIQEASKQGDLSSVGFWFIDYRHNKNRKERSPNDAVTAKLLFEHGGTIFQSQYEDYEECIAQGLQRCIFLPLAADPFVWSNAPVLEKRFHLSFAGNVWDRGRAAILEKCLNVQGLKFGFFGHGKTWKEKAAALLRMSLAGFNVNSFYGEPYAYDVNMRVFETLSCGVPLITNYVPSLERIFPKECSYIRWYHSEDELFDVVHKALHDEIFLRSGDEGRKFIVKECTYEHRVKVMIEALKKQDLI
jgi:glycosyltransferase involved in cell wall biosynthesis